MCKNSNSQNELTESINFIESKWFKAIALLTVISLFSVAINFLISMTDALAQGSTQVFPGCRNPTVIPNTTPGYIQPQNRPGYSCVCSNECHPITPTPTPTATETPTPTVTSFGSVKAARVVIAR